MRTEEEIKARIKLNRELIVESQKKALRDCNPFLLLNWPMYKAEILALEWVLNLQSEGAP